MVRGMTLEDRLNWLDVAKDAWKGTVDAAA
jgi:hypothetical protein